MLGAVWPELAEPHRAESLRQLAKEHGVSHESARRVIAGAKESAQVRGYSRHGHCGDTELRLDRSVEVFGYNCPSKKQRNLTTLLCSIILK